MQRRYCAAPYGGDLHTACRYCGVGLSCPADAPADRGLDRRPDARQEIIRRHNTYRDDEQAAFHQLLCQYHNHRSQNQRQTSEVAIRDTQVEFKLSQGKRQVLNLNAP